ncbi:MAG: hypothetical protein LBH16_09655 [Treponema sp.]|nr:hypothetical protein [Treponema sp.]
MNENVQLSCAALIKIAVDNNEVKIAARILFFSEKGHIIYTLDKLYI